MRSIIAIALVTALSMTIPACNKPASPSVPLHITATELYNDFQADEAAAKSRFGDKLLVITGEVSNYWGGGPPGAKPSITFQVDSGGTVSCSGSFPPPNMHANSNGYGKGQQVTVSCPGSSARYSALNKSVEMRDCY